MNTRFHGQLSVLTLLLMCTNFWGQTSGVTEKAIDSSAFKYTFEEEIFKDSNWSISLPIWIPGFRGSFAYGDVVIDPNYGVEPPDSKPKPSDRLQKSDLSISFYLIGKIGYTHNRFLIEIDGMSATLNNELSFSDGGAINFPGTIDATILRGFAGYRIYEKSIPSKLLKWVLWGYAGVRYYNVHVFAGNRNILDVRPKWAEPLLGVRIPVIYKRWVYTATTDYSGFGVDGHRSFYFSMNARYRASKRFSFGAGWNHLDVNFDSNYESEPMDLGIQLSGPVLNIRFDL